MRGAFRAALPWILVATALALAARPAHAQATLTIEPQEATIGDALDVRLTLDATDGVEPVRGQRGPQIGKFAVLDERWSAPDAAKGSGWVWTATIAAYETGELEFPAMHIAAVGDATPGWDTDPLTIRIGSVLDTAEDEGEAEIADLKPPAGVAPELGPLILAAVLVVLFLGLSAAAWWFYRRHAARFAAAPVVEDPFARTPPHEWAFAALRDLLDQRGRYTTDEFYARLSWILKRYLGGRYRVDLLEHTTDEVRPLLEQAGAHLAAVTRIVAVLGECDGVKFAKQRPTEGQRKDVVDRVYGIIDQTKPAEPRADERPGAA